MLSPNSLVPIEKYMLNLKQLMKIMKDQIAILVSRSVHPSRKNKGMKVKF